VNFHYSVLGRQMFDQVQLARLRGSPDPISGPDELAHWCHPAVGNNERIDAA
jgi:hypothetical protein